MTIHWIVILRVIPFQTETNSQWYCQKRGSAKHSKHSESVEVVTLSSDSPRIINEIAQKKALLLQHWRHMVDMLSVKTKSMLDTLLWCTQLFSTTHTHLFLQYMNEIIS